MTPGNETLPRLALSIPAGRLGAFRIEAGVVLALLALTGLVFMPRVGAPGAALFLASGCGLIALRPRQVLEGALRDWPVSLLVVFCILSFTWSREPEISLRHGVQLAATAAVTLAICDRLSPRAFCLSFAALLGLGMAASVAVGGVSGESAAWVGIYGSKNAFAGAASTFVIFALGVALARGGGPLLRLGALISGIAGIGLVVLAQSVGALVLLAVTLFSAALILTIPRLGRAAGLALFSLGMLSAALLALILSAHVPALSAFMLDATGKDLTLTGRTELWAVARDLIAERPFLGVGYQAFWVKGAAEAEALWFMFGIEGRSGFNFHNMYLSNAVEIGILGVLTQCFVLYGALVLTAIWTIRTGSAVPAIFFALMLMAVLGSVIEVPLFFQFSIRTVLVFAAYAYAREAFARPL